MRCRSSFIAEELTELVEEAVLEEFLRLDERGGVLGAMERQYQRSKIQDESLKYEHLKHSGALPIVGVNTFARTRIAAASIWRRTCSSRAPQTDEKRAQKINRVRAFQTKHASETEAALARLRDVALSGGNVFAELMNATRVASLGQISQALFEVASPCRRSM